MFPGQHLDDYEFNESGLVEAVHLYQNEQETSYPVSFIT